MADSLLAAYDALLLDLDGTVYHGGEVISGVPAVLDLARAQGVDLRFVTNNASKAPSEVTQHLRSLAITAEVSEVSTSAQAAALVLAEQLNAGESVLVVGTESLASEVAKVGLSPVRTAQGAAGVVQGHSPETAWPILAEASLAIQAGALWVACNADPTLPTERGPLPGNGSLVAALRVATGAEPVVAGKPEPRLLRMAVADSAALRPLVVGDRLDTDIAGAVAAGFDALLVLSGSTSPAEVLSASVKERPRYLASTMIALTESPETLKIGPHDGWSVRVEQQELVVSSEGSTDALALLRALCELWWKHDLTRVRAADEQANAALAQLELT